jgi:EAL domain-containing protein (putative c-di-GMP-specific phosphodiesterase class I)
MVLTLAIDAFGTGYPIFGYLRQLWVNKFKIDRSFIRDVGVNPDDAAIAGATISMAGSVNLKVIAEGVETEAQMSFLRRHHCGEIQGYYFSKPLAVGKVADKTANCGGLRIVRKPRHMIERPEINSRGFKRMLFTGM